MLRKYALLLICLLGLTTAVQAQDEPTRGSMTFENLERTYDIHVPDGLDEPAPLLIGLHGRFGTGAWMAEMSNFSALADAEGFIAVYPDGINNEWNYVDGIQGYPDAQDDVAFLNALVDHIAAEYPVDLTRVYLAGFSNGGFMAERMACSSPDKFAAFATVAAAGFGGQLQVCMEPGQASAPMLMIHGTADDNIPWDGWSQSNGVQTVWLLYPVPETMAYWAGFNRCAPERFLTEIPKADDPDTISVRVFQIVCPVGAQTTLYMVIDGGHNWPGMPEEAGGPWAGEINRDIDASAEIWAFFEQNHRDDAAR